MRGRSRFKRHRYRAEKMRELVRHVEHADAERRRLEALLGLALKIATHEKPCSEWVLLDVLAEVLDTDLAGSARLEERWKESKRAQQNVGVHIRVWRDMGTVSTKSAWTESTETGSLIAALEAVS